jgi:rubrerythrin
MRLWISGLLALTLLAGSIAVTEAAHHKVAKAAHLVYVCPESGVGADHAAACPVCKKPMGRVATYACMKCQISSDAPGPCPTCHEPMKSVAGLYSHCSSCGYYFLKSKKSCPVCAKKHRKLAHR